MLAITVPNFIYPSVYTLSEVDVPSVKEPTDILIRVHGASVNPINVKKADGKSNFAIAEEYAFTSLQSNEFSYRIGYDAAGTITQFGADVKHFKVGDAFYTRLPEASRGSWAECVVVKEFFVAPKPASLSFVEAAAVPLAAGILMQALELYEGDLRGKTLAKNVFGAGRVITTVSTPKVVEVPELLGKGVVDEVIDYTRTDILKTIPRGSIDFYFDTAGDCMQYPSLMKPKGGHIVFIATLPNGPQMRTSGIMRRPGNFQVPFYVKAGLSLLDGVNRLRARRWGSKYEYLMLEPSGDRLRKLGGYIEQGKLRTVVGEAASLTDLEVAMMLCWRVYQGKGGTVKMVFQVVEE